MVKEESVIGGILNAWKAHVIWFRALTKKTQSGNTWGPGRAKDLDGKIGDFILQGCMRA